MIIVSTPVEDLHKDQLSKPKGYLIKDILESGQ